MKGLHVELRQNISVYSALKETSDDQLLKYGLRRCPKCGGLGLQGVSTFDNNYTWTGEYCQTCKGTGLIGNFEDYLLVPLGKDHMYICKKCLGQGCSYCNFMGLVDWLHRATGSSSL